MPSQPFTTRRSAAPLVALDFGLQVRVQSSNQRLLFSGAGKLSLQELTSELSLMVCELRVRSFGVRHELEQLVSAVVLNVRCGFWELAERAAIDLGDLLVDARRRRLADAELCVRGSRCALRIADLCSRESR